MRLWCLPKFLRRVSPLFYPGWLSVIRKTLLEIWIALVSQFLVFQGSFFQLCCWAYWDSTGSRILAKRRRMSIHCPFLQALHSSPTPRSPTPCLRRRDTSAFFDRHSRHKCRRRGSIAP